MKTFLLPFCVIVCLYACSSPDNKAAITDSSKVDSFADATPAKPYAAEMQIFSGEDGITVPPYGLAKVKKLIARIRYADDTIRKVGTETMNEKSYTSLSFDEKFTYQMIHPETYSQVCELQPERKEEANRIYGQLPAIYGEYKWSDRQLDFFKLNRDSVAGLMKSLTEKNNEFGTNYKEAIVDMNGKEMIPFLIDVYNKEKKDHYLLTVLLLLMKKNEYPVFMNSGSYKKLYTRKSDEYSAYLNYNKENEDLIIQRATNFYNGLSRK